jgi:DHA1 family multidrug resistance protein-like MFS transporter
MVWFGLATSLWMLFAARILAGVLSSATSPTTMAYIGDSTPEKERGRGMGILGAAAGLGTVLGPALGGLLGQASLATPFFIAAGMSVLALVLAALFLPESLPAGQHRPARERKLIDLRAWGRAIWSPIGPWLALTALSTGGLMIFYGTFGLYALEQYGFGPDKVGLVFMVVGLATAVAQGALAGPLIKRWGETRVIQAGMLATAAAFVLLVVAGNLMTVLLAVAFFSLTTALQMPALMAITSRRATVAQGVAMGLSNSFISLGRIVGPTVGGILLDVHPNYPYVAGAALMLVGFVASLVSGVKEGVFPEASPPRARH